MTTLLLLVTLIIGSLLGFSHVLRDGSLLRFLDAHPHPQHVPPVIYYLGQGFMLFRDLPKATTYFIRIPERYPQSPYAATAYYRYLSALDEAGTPNNEMATLYETYYERYPDGPHTEMIRKKVIGIRNR